MLCPFCYLRAIILDETTFILEIAENDDWSPAMCYGLGLYIRGVF